MVEQERIEPEDDSREAVRATAEVEAGGIFDLGDSGDFDIANDKDSMIAEAFDSLHRRGVQPT